MPVPAMPLFDVIVQLSPAAKVEVAHTEVSAFAKSQRLL